MPNIIIGKTGAFQNGFFNNIVKNDLEINLDSAEYTSGTTWEDQTSNQRDFSLQGGLENNYNSTSEAFELDGTNDYAQYSWTGVPPNDFTFEFWVKPNSASGFFHVGGTNANGNFGINSGAYDRNVGVRSDGKAYFRIFASGDVVVAGGSVLDSNWHQIACALGSNGTRLYVDGSVVDTDTSFTGPSTFDFEDGLILGSDTNNLLSTQLGSTPPPNPFDGDLAIFRLYTTQLSDAEVLQNYNSNKSRF